MCWFRSLLKSMSSTSVPGLMTRIRETCTPLVLFGTGFLFRLLFYAYFGPISTPDTGGYVGVADALIAGHFYEQVNSILRLPGYPLFLALIFGLGGRSMAILVIVQQLLSAATAVIVYATACKVFDQSTGILAGWLIALNPALAYYGTVVLSETLAIFLGAMATWLIVLAIKINRAGFAVITGTVLAYLSWIKPNLLLLCPVYMVVVVILSSRLREAWLRLSLLALPVLFVFCGWTVHNALKFGHIVYAPSSGLNLLERTVYLDVPNNDAPIRGRALENFTELKERNALGKQADELYYSLAVINTWRERGETVPIPELNRQFFTIAWRQVIGDPVGYGMTTFREIAYIWAGYTPHWAKWRPTEIGEPPDWSFLILGPCMGLVMLALTVYGSAQACIRHNWLAFIYVLPVYLITLSTALLIPSDYRYRLVVEPQVLSLISYAINIIGDLSKVTDEK